MDIVKAKLDIIFKKLFTSDDEVLAAFLSDILDIPRSEIKEIETVDPNLFPDSPDGKQAELDLKLKVGDTIVNVEVQLLDLGNFRDRAVFYWSKMFSGELKKGDDYTALKKTISINILNFNLFECEELYSKFLLLEEKRHELLTDKCEIMFFELKKLSRRVSGKDRKKLWLQLINAETEEELDMLDKTGVPEIQKAVVILHEMSADEKTRALANAREKAILDELSAINYAAKNGEIKGRAEERAQTIAKMRKKGFTEEQIRDILEIDNG